MKFKVDVVIPLYNSEKYIKETLVSIENQMFKPDSVIVVNDGSTDKSLEIVEEYSRNSKLIIKIISKANGGLSSARNAGIKASDADWIAFLDSDDIWAPDKLKKQTECIEKSEFDDLGLVYCDCFVFNGDAPNGGKVFGIDRNLRGHIFSKMFKGNKITGSGSSVLIKRECFKDAGMFDEAFSAYEDWDMWIRISEKYAVDFVEEPLVGIRQHQSNMQKNSERMNKNMMVFFRKWILKKNISLVSRFDLLKHVVKKLAGTVVRRKEFITVRIFGGLGNQMFQYAAGRSLAQKHGVALMLDTSFFKSCKDRKFMLDRFNISKDVIISDRSGMFNSKIARKIMSIVKFPKWYYRNYSTVFDNKFWDLPKNVYLDGYFQSEKYFEQIEQIIRSEFVPAFEVSDDFKRWSEKIKNSNSVSIHIRRGDYLLRKNINTHGVLGIDYYEKAVSEIKAQIENPQFFIFSDDEQWCTENIVPITKNGQIVRINSENRDVEEFLLMSFCKHNIIANSSYSWWGAWLNENENKIVWKGV